eukprot:4939076-Pyramimonas_sp.AAC.1
MLLGHVGTIVGASGHGSTVDSRVQWHRSGRELLRQEGFCRVTGQVGGLLIPVGIEGRMARGRVRHNIT